jgi:formylglycine-generating enzyme required for sulfatase activity
VPGDVALGTRKVLVEKGVYLAVHEVTVGEFLAFARATKLHAARWKKVAPELPVVNIDFVQAQAYARWKDARLPTIAELRRAATSGGRARYPWGHRFEPHRLNSREAGLDAPLAPGSRPEGRSPHGLHDLFGNVAEWTSSQPERGGRYFVVGGSFLRRARGVIRTNRFTSYTLRPSEWRRDVGVRLARSLPPLVIPPPDAEPEGERAPPESGH